MSMPTPRENARWHRACWIARTVYQGWAEDTDVAAVMFDEADPEVQEGLARDAIEESIKMRNRPRKRGVPVAVPEWDDLAQEVYREDCRERGGAETMGGFSPEANQRLTQAMRSLGELYTKAEESLVHINYGEAERRTVAAAAKKLYEESEAKHGGLVAEQDRYTPPRPKTGMRIRRGYGKGTPEKHLNTWEITRVVRTRAGVTLSTPTVYLRHSGRSKPLAKDWRSLRKEMREGQARIVGRRRKRA